MDSAKYVNFRYRFPPFKLNAQLEINKMAKAPHPMKEEVIKWIVKQHDQRPFRSVKEAMDAASEQFKEVELPSTLRQWASEGTGIEGRKRRAAQALTPDGHFTVDKAARQIEQIKGMLIEGLKTEYKQVLVREKELEKVRQRLDQNIEQCATLTGMSRDEIDARLNEMRA